MVVRGGRVVTEQGVVAKDVVIRGAAIEALRSRARPRGVTADEVIDARDCWVLPGAIDSHVHTSLGGHSLNETMVEDIGAASRSALFGGVTTLMAYAHRFAGADLVAAVKSQIEAGLTTAWIDFGVHALFSPGDEPERSVPELWEQGVGGFKAMLAYKKSNLMIDDDELIRLMRAVAEVGGLLMIHPENGRVGDQLEQFERQDGGSDPAALLRSAPAELEADAMFKTALYARLMGCRLLFVHLTSAQGVAVLSLLRCDPFGVRPLVETQPHYALLTEEGLRRRGALLKVGPPLKRRADRAAVVKAIAEGLVSHISSDHAPRTKAVKLAKPSVLDAPYGGVAGVETLLPLAHTIVVERAGLDIGMLTRMVSTNVAKVFGLYPRKGTIRRGADADLVVVPIDGQRRAIRAAKLHGNSDYSFYEGITSRAFPRYVVRGGRLAVAEGELLVEAQSEYLSTRGTSRSG
jgi:dihydropyrimidinase